MKPHQSVRAYFAALQAAGAVVLGGVGLVRRDGTVRDTVIYSILANEGPDVGRHLELRLQRHA